jgi:hypothetical protein
MKPFERKVGRKLDKVYACKCTGGDIYKINIVHMFELGDEQRRRYL